MRQRLLNSFDKIWIDNLHGNRRASETGDDGKPSETIFKVAGFSDGIQQGVVITSAVKTGEAGKPELAEVKYRDDINSSSADSRRKQLVASLEDENFEGNYVPGSPSVQNRFVFKPIRSHPEYFAWSAIPELSAVAPLNGLEESRSGGLIDTDRKTLAARMEQYFNSDIDWEQLEASDIR